MDPWELAARESIRDLVARYNANGDAGRIAQMLELFAADAVLELVPGGAFRGRDAIGRFFAAAASGDAEAPPEAIRHFTATHQIDLVDEGAGRGCAYYAVLTDAGLDHWGRYLDRYARLDDRWLFRERRVTLDGAVPGGWGERTAARLAP